MNPGAGVSNTPSVGTFPLPDGAYLVRDAGLAIGFLDLLAEFAMVLNVRLDAQSSASARQRMAAILLRYGKAIFDTRYPVAQRGDLAAMIGTSRVMMYRTLRGLEADGLVKRQHGGGPAS
jgi:CRP-like cAMP-binding protein